MKHLTRRDFLKLCGTSSVGLALAACGVPPTATPAPTNTALPSSTPLPTATVTLTNTLVPMSTATATATAMPTATATPIPRTIGTLSNALGVGFAAAARVSQFSKQGYMNALNSFNAATFTEAHMTGWSLIGNTTRQAFRPAVGQYNWVYIDRAVEYAAKAAKPIQLTLHLVWSKQNRLPDWVLAVKDPQELERIMEDNIKTILSYT